jgi:hypothetical protein
MKNFDVVFDALGVAPVFARMACDEGTGTYTGIPGEGNWLKQADVSTIAYTVTDITYPDNESEVVASTSLTVSAVLSDTPTNTARNWKVDQIGYNFSHKVPAASFPTRGNRYRVSYAVTTTGGFLRHLNLVGPAI